MDTSTLFSVAPTFPMDDARIRERRLSRIARSPVTWGTLMATGALGFWIGAGFAGFVALYALSAIGLRKYWEKHRAAVDAASLRELVDESNASQDAELSRIVRHLESGGLPQYALCLGRFLSLKQKIEKAVHRERHLSTFSEEVEKGVDGICLEVCREITSIRERERGLGDALTSRDPGRLDSLESARRESHAAILHAYTSLYQTHAEILGLASTGKMFTGAAGIEEELPPGKRLNQILGGLQNEADLIARTHARIHRTLEASSSDLPRATESA